MKRYIAVMPNLLTVLRFPLSIQFILVLTDLLRRGTMYLAALSFMLLFFIYLTDFLDGRLARALKAVSKVGSLLDISADCFFIVLSLLCFNFYSLLPIWFTLVVVLDFCGFLWTSKLLGHTGDAKKCIPVFDKIGRAAAVLFYSIPALTCIVFIAHRFQPYLFLILCLNTVLALLSVAARCAVCYCAPSRNLTADRDIIEEK